MKKLTILLAIGLLLCAFSTAKADLIGVQVQFPDISFDSTTTISYSPGALSISAYDKEIKFSTNPADDYSLGVTSVKFLLSATIDNSGRLVPNSNTMTETLLAGQSVTIKGVTYTATGTPIVLLQGNVIAFGYDLKTVSPFSSFDFLLDNISGPLVTAGLWPSTVFTGILITGAGEHGIVGTLDWNHEWTLTGGKGDKGPVPEPATMLLLGSGLIGIGVFVRRKFKK